MQGQRLLGLRLSALFTNSVDILQISAVKDSHIHSVYL